MKQVFRTMILAALTAAARLALAVHKPAIIAITGSVGKTTTKDIITAVLREAGLSVRGSAKSYNGDFGVPLSILGLPSGARNPFMWLYILLASWCKAVFSVPKYIVLEVGLEEPGDIYDIVQWLHPDVSVLTKLPKHPVHLENFPDKETLYNEKIALLRATKQGGSAVYNREDTIQESYIRTLPKTITTRNFNGSEVSVASSGIHYDEKHDPIGTDVTLALRGKEEPMYMPNVLGEGAVQSLAAALAAVLAIRDDIAVSVMRRAIASRTPTQGRMRLLRGLNGSIIIDDSYNASPVAVEMALRALSAIDGKKKVTVLGGMAQLGDESTDIHRSVGKKASALSERVIIIGEVDYGKEENIHHVKNTDEAVKECRTIADTDTVFLCKGSQIARVEKVVEGLLDPSVDPKHTLVRQETCWN